MGSRRRSSFSEPNPGSTTSIGTSNNYGGSLEFQTSFSSASKSQCSDVVSEAVEEENPMAQMWRTPSLKEFSFKDLKIATNNFSPDCLLGEGGFGRVYKGWVDEETLAPSSKRGIGMAVAIKIWNSDKNYNAKLSGFGLAMLGPPNEESPISTVILGTYGYVAPEYIGTGNIYLKSDVYSYGVVLLELLTGLKVIDAFRPAGQQHLVEWLKPKLSQRKKVKTIMDVRMNGQYSLKAAVRAAQLSLRCLDSNPQSRPSIKEVVEELKEIEALKG